MLPPHSYERYACPIIAVVPPSVPLNGISRRKALPDGINGVKEEKPIQAT